MEDPCEQGESLGGKKVGFGKTDLVVDNVQGSQGLSWLPGEKSEYDSTPSEISHFLTRDV